MRALYEYLFPAMWLAYILYWRVMAENVKANQRMEPAGPRLLRLALMLCALALLTFPVLPFPWLNQRFRPPGPWGFWVGAVVTAAGLLFSVWGRRYLGTNWSRSVTLKQDHELITSGPYSVVRHPIYTGLLAALLGSAIAVGQWRGLLAVALVFIALWRKLRLEEEWMRAQFGDAYETYSRRVAALVPGVI